MGRRSRKRSVAGAVPEAADAPAPAPARPAPAALRRRAPSSERPPAPWGNFPLGELCTLAGIILMIVGFASSSTQALFVGLALVALSAVELVAREHFAGFRSHSALLALVIGFATGVVLVVVDAPRAVQIALAVVAFLAGFYFLRRTFKDKTGGMGFRA